MTIFISGLSYSVNDTDLKTLFEEFGTITSVKVIVDRITSKSKGFGFVEMENNDEAKKAIIGLDKTQYNGRVISVSEARNRE